ncbi:hypothetical protein RCL1_008724 [Eukaryota sp. TZLM3-RCL]
MDPVLLSSLLAFLGRNRDSHHPESEAHIAFNYALAWFQHACSTLNLFSAEPSQTPMLEQVFSLGSPEEQLQIETRSRQQFETAYSSQFQTPSALSCTSVPISKTSPPSPQQPIQSFPSADQSQRSTEALKFKDEGNRLFQNDQYEEALECYNKAIELDPSKAVFYYNSAVCLANLNRLNEALSAVEKANQLDPKYVKAWYRKGSILAKLERNEEAKVALIKCLELQPEHEAAQSLLSALGGPSELPQQEIPQAQQPNVQQQHVQQQQQRTATAQPSTVPPQTPALPADFSSMIGSVMSDPNFMSMASGLASQLFGGQQRQDDESRDHDQQSPSTPQCPQQ